MRLNEKPGLCRVFCLRLWVDDRKRLFRGDAAASLAFRADGWGEPVRIFVGEAVEQHVIHAPA